MRGFIKALMTLIILTVLATAAGCKGKQVDTQKSEKTKVRVFAKGFKGADGITIDFDGNMYVGNRNTNMISRVDRKGAVRDFAQLECDELLCLTADRDNNIYAAGRDKVFKISPEGEIKEVADGFTCADDLRLDPKGNIYVTDSAENRVYRITPELEKSIFIDSEESMDVLGSGWHITGITFDSKYENLYIARMKKGEILKYSTNSDGTAGTPKTIITGLPEPDHLEMDDKGRLYITLFREGSLIRVDNDGSGNIEYLSTGDMGYATGIVLGRGGYDADCAYVADYGKNVVYEIDIEDED